MGKHSDSRPSLAENLVAAARAVGGKKKGRHSGEQPSTATGILRTVKRRPVLAGLLVPAAAGMALVVGGVTLSPDNGGGDNQVVTAATSPEASESATAEASASASPEASESKAPKTPEQKNDGINAAASAKPTPKPSPSKSSSSSSSPEESDGGSSSKAGGVSDAPCDISPSIESGLTANAKKAYRAVCAEFPDEISSIGGARSDPGSDHNGGQALDIMTESAGGKKIREYLIANASELNAKYVIHEQRIWMPGSGWKGMEDRGSATQNHMDHVHLSVN